MHSCPLILFREKAMEFVKGELRGEKKFDVAQTVMNLYCHYSFINLGWTPQPYVIKDAKLRADYNLIQVVSALIKG